jgi:F-type H+-transporting ATPase subunit delta
VAASSAPTIATRYVTALLGHVTSPAAREALTKELAAWAVLFKPKAELADFARNPTLTRDVQARTIAAIAEKQGASAELKQLLVMLARQRRLSLLPEVAKQFHTLVLAERGFAQAEVISAKKLSDDQKKPIQEILGAKTEISWREDASLLGGFVMHRGGTTLDLSVSGQLRRAAQALGADVSAAA